MRSDMAKVIVERPRKKGWAWHKPKGYRRRLRRYGDEGPPGREGIKACWRGHTKFLNEHLGPLRRYLDSQVGRPWDKVFSEICAHIDRSSAVQDHVRDHVADYVVTRVILVDGVPCSGEGGCYGEPLSRLFWKGWYVCPRTGTLNRIKHAARSREGQGPPAGEPRYVRVGDSLQCRLVDGAWYLVTVKPLPLEGSECPARDVVLGIPVTALDEETARRQYGDAVYAASKRRLAKRELRQYPVPIDLCR